MMTRIQTARELLTLLEFSKVNAQIDESGKLTLRPSDRVTSEIQERCREYLTEIKALLVSRESADAASDARGVPCFHCRGSGFQPSALEMLDSPGGLAWT